MPEPFSLVATDKDAGVRLDVFLASAFSGISRARVQKAIAAGLVLVNGAEAHSRTRLAPGDDIRGTIADPDVWSVEPEDIPLDIVYHDTHLAVVNKPRGLAVHPGSGRAAGTLVNALAASFGSLPEGSARERPGIVHRLDKDTSGLMLIALEADTMTKLGEMIARREVQRRYLALLWGSPAFQKAVVDAAIGRDPRHPERMAVLPDDSPRLKRQAITELEVLERFSEAALVEAVLKTGRTHQIRVHCAYAGHPVVGDQVYGSAGQPTRISREDRQELTGLLDALAGQALHAWKLRFRHPVSDEELAFEVPPPPAMAAVLDFFRRIATAGKPR